jgi:hypothetical protein
MQRAAHRPRPEDGPVGEGALDIPPCGTTGTETDGPQAARIVLGLHRTKPADDLGRVLQRRCGDVLVPEPLPGNLSVLHQGWKSRQSQRSVSGRIARPCRLL